MMFNLLNLKRSDRLHNQSASAKRRSAASGRRLSLEQLETRSLLTAVLHPAAIRPFQPAIPNLGILTLDRGNVFSSLLHSGNGGIVVNNGDIYIDSSNSRGAGFTSGDGSVRATTIFVDGGLSHSGRGNFVGVIDTGAPQVGDPLAGLPAPLATGPFFAHGTLAATPTSRSRRARTTAASISPAMRT